MNQALARFRSNDTQITRGLYQIEVLLHRALQAVRQTRTQHEQSRTQHEQSQPSDPGDNTSLLGVRATLIEEQRTQQQIRGIVTGLTNGTFSGSPTNNVEEAIDRLPTASLSGVGAPRTPTAAEFRAAARATSERNQSARTSRRRREARHAATASPSRPARRRSPRASFWHPPPRN